MPQHSITLTSPFGRVHLTPPTEDHDQVVAECRVHPAVRRYLRFLPVHMTAQEAKARRESRADDVRIIDFYVELVGKDNSRTFAGQTGYFNLDEENRSCEAGIVLHPDLHGQNLATETFYVLLEHLFEDRKLHRVTFETGTDNVAMRGWLEKVVGARLEAQRKEVWREVDGAYTDVMGYAILEWEWKDRIKTRLTKRLETTNYIS